MWTSLLVLALAALALSLLVARSASAHEPHKSVALELQGSHTRVPIGQWLRNLARRHLNWKVNARRATKAAASGALKRWLSERECSPLLPSEFFCPEEPLQWGVGQALTWNGRVPGVWTSPSSPREPVRLESGAPYTLRSGVLYWLTCYAWGDRGRDTWIGTSLWYRLRSGGYVNDGWLETGTNDVIPGVRRC
jgi:hypothetical protein